MSSQIVIAVDADGGDHAPEQVVKGAVAALQVLSHKPVKLILVGRQNKIMEHLTHYSYDKNLIEIVNTTQVIGNDEVPTVAIKQKKDSSIVVGLKLVKEGRADCFVSAGNTGALLTGATVIVGRIKGIERPALGTLLPNKKGFSFLIDCGANVDAKPTYLAQFAKMGSVYMEHVVGVTNPRVGLVNIGVEKEKGNALTKEAYELLENGGVNFVGNVEARDIPHGAVDVMVCDAFVGNVILKLSEGYVKALFSMIKAELMSSWTSKIGALLSKKAFSGLKSKFDYREVGGAPFLGLKSLVVKAHGSSDSVAFVGAIKQCVAFVEADIVSKIQDKM